MWKVKGGKCPFSNITRGWTRKRNQNLFNNATCWKTKERSLITNQLNWYNEIKKKKNFYLKKKGSCYYKSNGRGTHQVPWRTMLTWYHQKKMTILKKKKKSLKLYNIAISVSSVQSLSRVWLFATPWTTACQASLSITNSRSPPKPMSIKSVMPSNHLILCCPLLLLPSIFPSIRVFSNESALRIRWPKYWSFSFRTDLL